MKTQDWFMTIGLIMILPFFLVRRIDRSQKKYLDPENLEHFGRAFSYLAFYGAGLMLISLVASNFHVSLVFVVLYAIARIRINDE